MYSLSQRRKMAENLIYNFMNAMEGDTRKNSSLYKERFKNLTDNQFKSMSKDINEGRYRFYFEVEAFERNLDYNNAIFALERILNKPFFEYVIYTDPATGEKISSQYKMPVGPILQKRVQQNVLKKNDTTMDVTQRNNKTGQVTNHSKVVRNSDMENNFLEVLGLNTIAKEFNSFRADSKDAKEVAYSSVSSKGYVSLADLPDDISEKVAINTLDTYYLGALLDTDLVRTNLFTNYTKNRKQKEVSDRTSKVSK